VLLRRGVRQELASIVACAVKHAKNNNADCVEIHGNTFDFYSFYPDGGFSNGVSFKRRIDISEILLCHQTVHGFSSVDADVFVINRDIRGKLALPVECFEIDERACPSDQEYERYCTIIESGNLSDSEVFSNLYASMSTVYETSFTYFDRRWERVLSSFGASMGKKIDSFFPVKIKHMNLARENL
jgi:hypothetical protein